MKLPTIESVLLTSDASDGSAPSATEEEVFCEYLEARVQQALETLNSAREELSAKPQDFNRAVQVMRYVYELRDLKLQLEAQRARVDSARQAAGLTPLPKETPFATTEFRAAQAEQAAKIMTALGEKPRTCPSCQAPILAADAACRCSDSSAVDFSDTNHPVESRDSLA